MKSKKGGGPRSASTTGSPTIPYQKPPLGPPGPEPEEGPSNEAIRERLLSAYDSGRRDLPWRRETDPYRIWVSEVMLQQTRVETVIPYYERWVDRFPDMESLAEAEEDEVLRVWQGLGYYSRARRLQEGARVVRERFAGALPRNSETLREIPGIGEYTAGAVASIAFGEVVPAVDGNVKRVLARLYDLPGPTPGEYRSRASELVDPHRPGDFNQALMELGALVCTPKNPRCDDCPIREECLARQRGTVAERPVQKAKKKIPEVDVAVLVAVAPNRRKGSVVGADGRSKGHERTSAKHPGPFFLLRKRPAAGLLAGMWEFPGTEVAGGSGTTAIREAVLELARVSGLDVDGQTPQPMDGVTHVFSHLKCIYRPMLLSASSAAPDPTSPGEPPHKADAWKWATPQELDAIPLPVAQQKILRAALAALGKS
jgi:A/G-specific adenine glycosylase